MIKGITMHEIKLVKTIVIIQGNIPFSLKMTLYSSNPDEQPKAKDTELIIPNLISVDCLFILHPTFPPVLMI